MIPLTQQPFIPNQVRHNWLKQLRKVRSIFIIMSNDNECAVEHLVENDTLYQDELLLDWLLSENEIKFVNKTTKAYTSQLYFALQYKHLQLEGDFFKDDTQLSEKIIAVLARQLELNSNDFNKVHRNSKAAYKKAISHHLGFRSYTKDDYELIEDFIAKEMHKDFLSIDELKSKVYKFMLNLKLLRPSDYNFIRKLKRSRIKALEAIYSTISGKLSSSQKDKLLQLLDLQPNLLTKLHYYKKSPPEPSAFKIDEFITRYNVLDEIGITQLSFPEITQTMYEKLEMLGRSYDSNNLAQIQFDNKKLALLICMLFSASKTLLDHILEMNEQLLLKKERISKNSFNKSLRELSRNAKKGLKYLIKATKSWLHHESPDDTNLSDFKKTIDEKKLTDAIDACENLNKHQASGYYSILENKYTDLRKYMPQFFNLPFEGAVGMEAIIESITKLRQLNQIQSNKLPEDVPIGFVPKTWFKAMNQNGKLTRRTWEMALYYKVKKHINSGDLYLSHSNKHQYFWNTVYNDTDWATNKPSAFNQLGFPEKFDGMLKILKKEYYEGVELAKASLSSEVFAYINAAGELKLKKEDALEVPGSVKKLKAMIQKRLPTVRIEKVLSDIDAKTHFSKLFTVPDGFEQKSKIEPEELYAAIIALGTNLGLSDMSNSTEGISLETLKHVAQWCIRPKTIEMVNDLFVKKHSQHPLSQ
jgi:hypothetical protein